MLFFQSFMFRRSYTENQKIRVAILNILKISNLISVRICLFGPVVIVFIELKIML